MKAGHCQSNVIRPLFFVICNMICLELEGCISNSGQKHINDITPFLPFDWLEHWCSLVSIGDHCGRQQ